MGVCPVCGCKTDELDFVAYSMGGSEERVCSFCEKQLKAFDSGEVTKAHLRWLEAVCEKQVPDRSGAIVKYLDEIKEKNIKPEEAAVKSSQPVPAPAANRQNAEPAKKQQYAFPGDAAAAQTAAPGTAELEARIAALEKKVDRMKKTQLIRNALEIILPIMLFLLIILVFFASGTYEKLKELFSIATEYMAVSPSVFTNIFIG